MSDVTIYRVYAPVNLGAKCGTVEYGIFREFGAARDRLARVAAKMTDSGCRVTWLSGTGFMVRDPGGRIGRATIHLYYLDAPISEDLVEDGPGITSPN